jgi:hypothetical protein
MAMFFGVATKEPLRKGTAVLNAVETIRELREIIRIVSAWTVLILVLTAPDSNWEKADWQGVFTAWRFTSGPKSPIENSNRK